MGGNDYEYDGLMGGNQLGWNDNDYTNLITKDGQFDYDAEKEKDAAKRTASGNGAGCECFVALSLTLHNKH